MNTLADIKPAVALPSADHLLCFVMPSNSAEKLPCSTNRVQESQPDKSLDKLVARLPLKHATCCLRMSAVPTDQFTLMESATRSARPLLMGGGKKNMWPSPMSTYSVTATRTHFGTC
jgi:hypothetical protein